MTPPNWLTGLIVNTRLDEEQADHEAGNDRGEKTSFLVT